jgi:alkylation response protein AidB-like acyl-CoA dehydrogenase
MTPPTYSCWCAPIPEAPKKQQGISFVLVDMDQPGITVRTIRTLAGEEEFCEVFFDDARTPRSNLVGEINQGWTMAKALLSFERIFIGAPSLAQSALGQLETLARSRGSFEDPVFRDRYAEVALDVEDHAALYARFADQVRRGETLGPDVSMLKIWVTETFQKITELMIQVAGPDGGSLGPLQLGNVGVDVLSNFYKARPTTIYGGSNEIQRNILSKAVLDLPG